MNSLFVLQTQVRTSVLHDAALIKHQVLVEGDFTHRFRGIQSSQIKKFIVRTLSLKKRRKS